MNSLATFFAAALVLFAFGQAVAAARAADAAPDVLAVTADSQVSR